VPDILHYCSNGGSRSNKKTLPLFEGEVYTCIGQLNCQKLFLAAALPDHILKGRWAGIEGGEINNEDLRLKAEG